MLKLGQEFAAAAGCGDQTAQCLRSLTVEQVLKHQGGILSKVVDFPSVDGIVITSPALAAFSQGAYNRVPIMTGLVKDEQAFFLPELNTKKPLTDEEYKRYAATYGAEHAEALLKKYPVETYGTPSLAEIAMAQGAKACTARLLDMAWSKHATVYAYQFEDRTAPSYSPAVSYPMRAYHTAELQYLFPLFRGGQGTSHPLSPEQERLSDIIVDYWTAFARTGDPNGKGEGAPPRWEPYSTDKDNVQSLDQPAPRIALGYRASNDCTLWDRVLSYR
jgi:para-nitrobenzyl esterase